MDRDSEGDLRRDEGWSRRQVLHLAGYGSLGTMLASVLTGCEVSDVAADDDAKEYTIEMIEPQRYETASLTVRSGSIIVWKNQTQMPHTSTCDPALGAPIALPAGAETWDSGDLYPGQSWSHTLTTPGVYVFGCRHHYEQGMIGTITVSG